MQTQTEPRNLGGRPPTPDDQRMISIGALRFRPAMLAEIDAIVAADLAGTDRSTVIRNLVAEALEMRRKKGGR